MEYSTRTRSISALEHNSEAEIVTLVVAIAKRKDKNGISLVKPIFLVLILPLIAFQRKKQLVVPRPSPRRFIKEEKKRRGASSTLKAKKTKRNDAQCLKIPSKV